MAATRGHSCFLPPPQRGNELRIPASGNGHLSAIVEFRFMPIVVVQADDRAQIDDPRVMTAEKGRIRQCGLQTPEVPANEMLLPVREPDARVAAFSFRAEDGRGVEHQRPVVHADQYALCSCLHCSWRTAESTARTARMYPSLPHPKSHLALEYFMSKSGPGQFLSRRNAAHSTFQPPPLPFRGNEQCEQGQNRRVHDERPIAQHRSNHRIPLPEEVFALAHERRYGCEP